MAVSVQRRTGLDQHDKRTMSGNLLEQCKCLKAEEGEHVLLPHVVASYCAGVAYIYIYITLSYILAFGCGSAVFL